MKKQQFFYLALILTVYHSLAFGQTNSDDDIILNVFVPADSKLSQDFRDKIDLKISTALAGNSVAGSNLDDPRYVVKVRVTEQSAEVLSEQVFHYVNLEVTLTVADAFEKLLFDVLDFSIKGAGKSKELAYSDALKRINTQNSNLKTFFQRAKSRIRDYYNNNCSAIKDKALLRISKNEYDAAIYGLLAIPSSAEACYKDAVELTIQLVGKKLTIACEDLIASVTRDVAAGDFNSALVSLSKVRSNMPCFANSQTLLQEVLNKQCGSLLAKAKSSWAKRQLDLAASFLGEINSISPCATDAQTLITEIGLWVKEKENREWNLTLQAADRNHEIQKLSISAAREVGMAYANAQPKELIYNNLNF